MNMTEVMRERILESRSSSKAEGNWGRGKKRSQGESRRSSLKKKKTVLVGGEVGGKLVKRPGGPSARKTRRYAGPSTRKG